MSARLRAARERAGLTIADISASTKLSPSVLQAIERGDFSKLPGDFYTRAFLRTYARELHLSPDAVAAEFEADRRAAQPSGNEASPSEASPRAVTPRPAATWEPPLRGPWSRFLAIAGNGGVVIAVVVVLLVVTVARSRPVAPQQPEAGAVGTTGLAAPAPASSAAAPNPAAPVAVEKLVLDIQATGPIWVTGAADGKRVLYRLLAPGERVRVEARDAVAFRVGDAASFSYTINGVEGKMLGAPGEVRDVQITRENYRTFRR